MQDVSVQLNRREYVIIEFWKEWNLRRWSKKISYWKYISINFCKILPPKIRFSWYLNTCNEIYVLDLTLNLRSDFSTSKLECVFLNEYDLSQSIMSNYVFCIFCFIVSMSKYNCQNNRLVIHITQTI